MIFFWFWISLYTCIYMCSSYQFSSGCSLWILRKVDFCHQKRRLWDRAVLSRPKMCEMQTLNLYVNPVYAQVFHIKILSQAGTASLLSTSLDQVALLLHQSLLFASYLCDYLHIFRSNWLHSNLDPMLKLTYRSYWLWYCTTEKLKRFTDSRKSHVKHIYIYHLTMNWAIELIFEYVLVCI